MDFPLLCQSLDVRLDDRYLPSEPKARNKMTPSTVVECDEAKMFLEECRTEGHPPRYPPFNMEDRPHEGTLSHRMAVRKAQNQMPCRRRRFVGQGPDVRGSTYMEHLGNLEVENVARGKTRTVAYQQEKKRRAEEDLSPRLPKRVDRKEERREGQSGKVVGIVNGVGRKRKVGEREGVVDDDDEEEEGLPKGKRRRSM